MIISTNKINFDVLLQLNESYFSENAKRIINEKLNEPLFFNFKKEQVVSSSELTLLYSYLLTDKMTQGNFKNYSIQYIVDLAKYSYQKIANALLNDEFFSNNQTDIKDLLSVKDFEDTFIHSFNKKSTKKGDLLMYMIENKGYFLTNLKHLENNRDIFVHKSIINYCLYQDINQMLSILDKKTTPTNYIRYNLTLLLEITSVTKEEKEILTSFIKKVINRTKNIAHNNYESFIKLLITLNEDEHYEEKLLLNRNKFYETRMFFELNQYHNGNYFIHVEDLLEQIKIHQLDESFEVIYQNYDYLHKQDRFLHSDIIKNLLKFENIIKNAHYQHIAFTNIEHKDEDILQDLIDEIDNLFDIYREPQYNVVEYNNIHDRIMSSFNQFIDQQYYMQPNDLVIYDQDDSYLVMPF